MKTISLIGFQGISRRNSPPFNEQHPLIQLGHVGMSFTGDSRIFGFRPTQKATDDAGGMENLLDKLKDGTIVEGGVFDDRFVFERAYDLRQDAAFMAEIQRNVRGEKRLIVYCVEQTNISEARFDEIYRTIVGWMESQTTFKYRLPQKNDPQEPSSIRDAHNCATFPERLQLTLPELRGLLNDYIPALAKIGREWKPDVRKP